MAQEKLPARAQELIDFQPQHDFFVGIDSDGCAMDAMNIKQMECFTPNTIKWWGLSNASVLVRETALYVNLYSKTRGLNRWIALAEVFKLLKQRPEVLERVTVPEGKDIQAFLDSGLPLSDAGIEEFAAAHPDSDELQTALKWGKGVNDTIAEMVIGCGPFPGVKEAMAAMEASGKIDQMTVSATPNEALYREWGEHGIAQYMTVIAGQEYGNKTQQIRFATEGKYADEHVLMIGDAPGDGAAADGNNALFYPINPGHEVDSWHRFKDEALGKFLDGTFAGAYQKKIRDEFDALLPSTPPWQ